eukprot:3160072-Pleurochrysis_carterae.AAC.1
MADKDFKIWKGETKVFMAIERTMIGWLRYAGTIGVGAFAVNVLGHGSFKGATGALGAAQGMEWLMHKVIPEHLSKCIDGCLPSPWSAHGCMAVACPPWLQDLINLPLLWLPIPCVRSRSCSLMHVLALALPPTACPLLFTTASVLSVAPSDHCGLLSPNAGSRSNSDRSGRLRAIPPAHQAGACRFLVGRGPSSVRSSQLYVCMDT